MRLQWDPKVCTFGMDLVELQSKDVLKERARIDEEELQENCKSTATRKKKGLFSSSFIHSNCKIPTATVSGSKNYILRSILDPIIVEHASQTQIENETSPQAYGIILSWSTCDQLELIGVYSMSFLPLFSLAED
jgi:melanoma-associated antigen